MPSPGMVTTVYLAMNDSESPRDEGFDSPGDNERLWNRAQRRETELVTAPCDNASGKVNDDLFVRNDGLLACRDLRAEIRTQARNQLRRLEAQQAVVEGVAQVGLRERSGDNERNAFGVQRRRGLLAAGAGAEVEAAHQNVTRSGASCELRVVVFKDNLGHLLWRDVIAVGIGSGIDRVGVQVIFRHKHEAAEHAGRKTSNELDGFSHRGESQTFEALVKLRA